MGAPHVFNRVVNQGTYTQLFADTKKAQQKAQQSKVRWRGSHLLASGHLPLDYYSHLIFSISTSDAEICLVLQLLLF
jgi:hypothetical protein